MSPGVRVWRITLKAAGAIFGNSKYIVGLEDYFNGDINFRCDRNVAGEIV